MKRREFLKFSAAASAVVAAGLQSECASTCKGEEESTFDYGELYCSPEVMKDIKNWGVDCIDEYTRKEILTNRR